MNKIRLKARDVPYHVLPLILFRMPTVEHPHPKKISKDVKKKM